MDLRSVYFARNRPVETNTKVTSVQFVANIEGNVGASLDISWVTGEREDAEEEIQHSTNPFAVGLLSTERDSEVGGINLEVRQTIFCKMWNIMLMFACTLL